MLFPTIDFAVFFALVFPVTWSLNSWNFSKKIWLVAASYLFYSFWDWRFLFLLFFSSIGNFCAGMLIGSAKGLGVRRLVLAVAVALNLSVLGYFKYYNFLSLTLSNVLARLGLNVDFGSTEVALPIAISFLTFHGLSYIIDVYRGRIAPSKSAVDLLLYISFFPHLVAGPIVRAHDFLPQLERRSDPSTIRVGQSVFLILGGLFKKVVIASHVSTLFVDPIFVEPTNYGTIDLILGMYAYAVVIYCDFSAYTDIAIGIANLLGYQFPQNFDQPYRALSLQDFWRRWHMTLSTWLRDYLYISLGGNRHGTFATYRNLIITMGLGGLWHGAGLQFIVWGLMHGVGLAVERALGLRQERDAPRRGRFTIFIAWFVTFHFVCIAWVFFRSPSLDAAAAYFGTMFSNPTVPSTITWFVAVWMAVGFLTQWIDASYFRKLQGYYERSPLAAKVLVPFAVIYVIAVLSPVGIPPFIYFQF
ncbi:MAG: MBOAT family protein [Methylobacteriaceae bacterium]|nr:MBOAT family protein [Methylobacteriaceae bacterium]